VMYKHIPTEKIREFSLSRLKGSFEKMLQKNDQLTFENEVLRRNIKDLQQMKNVLMIEQNDLFKERTPSSNVQKIDQDMIVMDLNNREQRTRGLMGILIRDIDQLKTDMGAFDRVLGTNQFEAEKQIFLERKDSIRQDINKLESRLKLLREKNAKSLSVLERMKSERVILEQKVDALEGGFDRL